MYIYTTICFLMYCCTIKAQQEVVSGKIVYEAESANPLANNRFIDMWFSSSAYVYQYRGISKTGSSDKLINNEQTNLGKIDSSKLLELENQLKEDRKKEKADAWTARLDEPVQVYHSFMRSTQMDYCIPDTVNFVKWQLLPDTLTVRGIKCQKAIGESEGMQFVAWFAPSIPITAAPLKYRGLPGLLIECTNKTRNTRFGMVELNWPSPIPAQIENYFTCSRFISKQEFKKLIDVNNEKTLKLMEAIEQSRREKKPLDIKSIQNR